MGKRGRRDRIPGSKNERQKRTASPPKGPEVKGSRRRKSVTGQNCEESIIFKGCPVVFTWSQRVREQPEKV